MSTVANGEHTRAWTMNTQALVDNWQTAGQDDGSPETRDKRNGTA